MKLIYCTECGDVVSLRLEPRACLCGKSSGQYGEDRLNATYSGPAIPLGFTNWSFLAAKTVFPFDAHGDPLGGKRFEAFIIPADAATMKKLP